MVVTGQIGKAEAIVEEIVAERRNVVARADPPDDQPQEQWAETREQFAAIPREQLEQERESLAKLEADAEPYPPCP